MQVAVDGNGDAKWNVLVLLNIFTLLVCLLSVSLFILGGDVSQRAHRGQRTT